jgi:hypothetical protein
MLLAMTTEALYVPSRRLNAYSQARSCALLSSPNSQQGHIGSCAYDEAEGYALVSGGQPTIPGENGGCKTGTGTNNSGLWIFTRSQERNDDVINKVRSIAETAGFDTSVLNDVVQDGCDYGDTDSRNDSCKDEAGTTFRMVWCPT